jgi:hypothetical protein
MGVPTIGTITSNMCGDIQQAMCYAAIRHVVGSSTVAAVNVYNATTSKDEAQSKYVPIYCTVWFFSLTIESASMFKL